jgi:hypothetical protein
MYRALTLGILAMTCLLVGMNSQGGRGAQSLPCDWILLPQNDQGGCVSLGNPVCPDSGGGECCQHFHLPLAWNQACHWWKSTGMVKGPSIKKYYTAHDDWCCASVCTAGATVTDTVHYQTEDTLAGCPH